MTGEAHGDLQHDRPERHCADDPGAHRTVAGPVGGFPTVINAFAVGDTIDVTRFVAVSKTFNGAALVLTDGVGYHATLGIQADFATPIS